MGLFNFFKKEKPVPFSLTSKDLAHVDGMMAYCDTFGFQCGASADLCRFLFSAAEKEAASDGQVMTVFMALNDYQSAAINSGFCAVVFSASKVIVSRSGSCDVYPGNEIISFRSEPSDSKTVILMEHKGGVCRFGVDPSKAAGILGCCTNSFDDFKKIFMEQNKTFPSQHKPVAIKTIGIFPKRLDGAPIYKVYVLDISPAPGVDLLHDVLRGEERILNVRANGSLIEVLNDGSVVGTIEDPKRAEMLSDWERKGLPSHCILLSNGKVNLRFYKDKREGNSFRKQDVVSLTAYRSDDSQYIISLLENGDELDVEEDLDKDNVLHITYDGDRIGNLPKKIAEKVFSEGCYGVFYEDGEEDDDGIVKPSVRIYW